MNAYQVVIDFAKFLIVLTFIVSIIQTEKQRRKKG